MRVKLNMGGFIWSLTKRTFRLLHNGVTYATFNANGDPLELNEIILFVCYFGLQKSSSDKTLSLTNNRQL